MKKRNSIKYTSLNLRLLFFVMICNIYFAFGQSHQPTPSLVDVPSNTWVLIDKGSVTAPRNIMSYSGGWYDPQYHQFCIFGGGHWDYWGNEVWSFDIVSLTWKELYPPDPESAYDNYNNEYPGALFNPANEPIEDANPMSKHTYDQMEFVEGLGPVIWGGYSWGDSGTPWCQNCEDTWAFDYANKKWLYLYNGKNPSPNYDAGVGASAYASNENKLYSIAWGETWTFDPTQYTWNKINESAPSSIEATMEYDSKRNVLYYYGGRYPTNTSLYRFNISENSWSKLSPGGTPPSSRSIYGPGMAYDSENDVLLVFHSGTIWAYHPDQNEWEELKPENRPSDSDYVFGRFRYDPINKGAWFHGWQNGQHTTWFYRYKNNVPVQINNGVGSLESDQIILEQNYPNPFNAQTNIKYQLTKSCSVKIKIYDYLGQEITTLIHEIQVPGIYNIKWDASDISSGIYFIHLVSENSHVSKKILLIK